MTGLEWDGGTLGFRLWGMLPPEQQEAWGSEGRRLYCDAQTQFLL